MLQDFSKIKDKELASWVGFGSASRDDVAHHFQTLLWAQGV
jgi:hypothetical protein